LFDKTCLPTAPGNVYSFGPGDDCLGERPPRGSVPKTGWRGSRAIKEEEEEEEEEEEDRRCWLEGDMEEMRFLKARQAFRIKHFDFDN
jgi:hypothetical protein